VGLTGGTGLVLALASPLAASLGESLLSEGGDSVPVDVSVGGGLHEAAESVTSGAVAVASVPVVVAAASIEPLVSAVHDVSVGCESVVVSLDDVASVAEEAVSAEGLEPAAPPLASSELAAVASEASAVVPGVSASPVPSVVVEVTPVSADVSEAAGSAVDCSLVGGVETSSARAVARKVVVPPKPTNAAAVQMTSRSRRRSKKFPRIAAKPTRPRFITTPLAIAQRPTSMALQTREARRANRARQAEKRRSCVRTACINLK
jgi:hypothetical protein